jgi:predicted enzyme related to lactoylglutathione lyase
MNRVVHFEIHATNPERAARFYSEVFGWDINEWTVPGVEASAENRYWLVGTGPRDAQGIDGGLMVRRGPPPADGQPVNAYICTIQVASLDEYTDKAVAAGASVALPKMPIKGVGWLAYFKDTEGNLFGMMETEAG